MSAEPNRKRSKTYYFHSEWQDEFFFTMVEMKCMCMICHSQVALPKKSNVRRHYTSLHKNYETDFPLGSDQRRNKVIELKSKLQGQETAYTRPVTKPRAATIASFRVSNVLAKRKKPFEDGEMVKEAFLEAADSLFDNFKNKSEIMSAIKDVQLSRNTVKRRVECMSEDVTMQLRKDLEDCVYFSLQFDESTDATETSQVCIFIRMAFEDLKIKEEILKIISLRGKICGKDIYQSFKAYIKEENLPIRKLVSVTTDGTPALTDTYGGFITLCQLDDDFPSFFTYHCVIHPHALCGKMLGMKNVMDTVLKIMNSIRTEAWKNSIFRSLLEELEAQHSDAVIHSDVRWFNKGQVLQKFRDSLPDISTLLYSTIREYYEEVEDSTWLLDLAFLTDFVGKLSELSEPNLQIQKKDNTIVDMISSVNSFKQKLKMFSTQLRRKELKHFPNLAAELQNQGNLDFDERVKYVEQVEVISAEFERRFQEFAPLEPVVSFVSFPFSAEVEETAEKIGSLFHLNSSDLENEIITLQNDLQLKVRASEKNFWNLVTEQKYPKLKNVAMCLTSFFGSSHLCESSFSNMKVIKTKFRTALTDSHMDDCMRLATTNYTPRYTQLAENMHCKSSS